MSQLKAKQSQTQNKTNPKILNFLCEKRNLCKDFHVVIDAF